MTSRQHAAPHAGARRVSWLIRLTACVWAASLVAGCLGAGAGTPASNAYSLDVASPLEPSSPVAATLDATAPEVDAEITIEMGRRFQTLQGFGAALAWHQGRLVGNVSDAVYELLFPELGLDILRFRNRFERSDRTDGNLAEEVEIFERASRALGHPPRLLLSSWSPPAALKANGRERCANNPNCTLAKRDGKFVYAEFADWWIRSLDHYASLGLYPDYISLQNEPDFIPGNWEGCKFTPEESPEYPAYGKALAALHARVTQREPKQRPLLLGPEVLGIHYHRIPNYLAALDSALLGGVAHHIYERGDDAMWDWREPGPDSFLDEMREVREATSLPTFQTEFNTDEDGGVDGGFETAWLMHHTLVTQGAVAFLYWDLIWAGNKGLVSLVGRTAKPRDHYYAVRHFARFTDPGYTRVSVESSQASVLASAYVSPDAKTATVVLLNTGRNVAHVTLRGVDGAPTSDSVLTTFRPGVSHRWQPLAVPLVTNGLEASEPTSNAFGVDMPARSVATIVFSDLAAPQSRE